ncbi:class I SAM-dependent DNA methyltransferase [Amycolatopsis cihanbeyliensis]|uniref:Methyltransferase family protein n=1 Tax=Amycolatopsis cihanbeyliensis TaxID=1128664 RepID=A0A542DCH7_AMYCI|nr:class I SAM-dependent methyltransferase [Amycolatopsis cihanbeyliensis]TQJ00755.1 methyltransferase family protein [Amycolatopsis cihanbeyliensis]
MHSDQLPTGNDGVASSRRRELEIELPRRSEHIDQDAEYCSVFLDGNWRKIRFHDYAEIYRIPGLYEQLFHDILDCRSPDVVGKLLKEELQRQNVDAASLRVLDLGAGNGLVGEQLRNIGAGHLVGVDIIPEAAEAARRDRPRVYDAYHIADVVTPPAEVDGALRSAELNTLCCVAALGYADIPPAAFRAAFNRISEGGWIAFTIKDRFLSAEDTSGFARLVRACEEHGLLQPRSTERYRHRVDVRGEPLHYVAIVGTKHADIPVDLLP